MQVGSKELDNCIHCQLGYHCWQILHKLVARMLWLAWLLLLVLMGYKLVVMCLMGSMMELLLLEIAVL
jgi:hypothetical protein